MHHRGYDEPPGNGGFLLNAGRMYVDMGHLEFASPECQSLTDLVASDRAGDCLIQDAINELGLRDNVSLIKNNVDHETDATFGCHENYLVSREFPFSYKGLGQLIPFLVTRQVFTGAGRIGAAEVYDGWIDVEQLGEKALQPVILQTAIRFPSRFRNGPTTSSMIFLNGCSIIVPLLILVMSLWLTPLNSDEFIC